jgi:hypothetical protein
MLRGLIGIFILITFYCMVVLLPIYATAHSNDVHGFPVCDFEFSFFPSHRLQVSTAVNLPSNSPRVWAVIVGYVVASVVVLLCIYRFSLYYLRKPVHLSQFGKSVLIDGLPRDIVDNEVREWMGMG